MALATNVLDFLQDLFFTAEGRDRWNGLSEGERKTLLEDNDISLEDVEQNTEIQQFFEQQFENEQTSTATDINSESQFNVTNNVGGPAAGATPGAAAAAASAPPPPPPSPSVYETVNNYVTYNTTNIDDRDTNLDQSVNQNITGEHVDVDQDFNQDTLVGGDGAVLANETDGDVTANTGERGVAVGDTDGGDVTAVTGDLENSQVIGGDNYGNAQNVGDGSQAFQDTSDTVGLQGSSVGGSIVNDSSDTAIAQGGGDAIQADDSAVATGDGATALNAGEDIEKVNLGEIDVDVDASQSLDADLDQDLNQSNELDASGETGDYGDDLEQELEADNDAHLDGDIDQHPDQDIDIDIFD